MIDINELRQSLGAVTPEEVGELLDRLEAAEKSDAESIAMYRKARDERDALRTKIAEMERQEHMDANELTTFYVWCPSLGITRNDAWEIPHTDASCAVEDWGEEYSMDNPRSPTGRNIYVEGGDVVEPLTYVLHTSLGYYAIPGAKGEEK